MRETQLQSAQSNAIAQASAQGLQQAVVNIEEVDYASKSRTAAEMTTAARQAF